jgi:putative FmdB family regulatory protein
MPTYEYECQKCGHVFDVFQSMTDERIKRCPKCRGKVKRLFGIGSGIIFKGSGFYENDYRRSGKAGTAKSKADTGSGESSSSSSTSGDKTETQKPASPAAPAKKD